MKKSERTLKMQEDYLKLRQKGVTISEIAEEYGLSKHVVYKSLGEIAQKNGVRREELLYTPHPNYKRKNQPVKKRKENIDYYEMVEEIYDLLEETNNVLSKISAIIKE